MKSSKESGNRPGADRDLAVQIKDFLERADRLPDTRQFADLLYGLEKLGRNLNRDKDKQRAVKRFELAVASLRRLAERHDDARLKMSLCQSCGQTYELLGACELAEKSFQQALQHSLELADQRTRAQILRKLANFEMKQDRRQEALDHLRQSLAICRELGELREQAAALNSMAIVYFQTKDWRKMGSAAKKALAIAENLGELKLVGSISNNLGAMYSVRGQWEKALLALQESIVQFERVGNERGLAETHNNLGTLYRDREMWSQAGESYARSIALARRAGDAFVHASANLNRVELYILMHDLEMAEVQSKRALQQFHDLGSQQGVADACRLLGIVYSKKHNFKLAENYFREAFEIFRAQEDALGLAETHAAYAHMKLGEDERALAAEHLAHAIDYYHSIKASKKVRQFRRELGKIANKNSD